MADLTSVGQKWLLKAGMSGQAFRLPEKLEPGKFDQVMSLWYTCFCGNMKNAQIRIMHAFKFLWRRDDSKLATRPDRGIALDISELKFLMSAGRIDRDDIPGITLEQWGAVESLALVAFEDIPAVTEEVNNVTNIIKAEVKKTAVETLETLDKIINHITNSYYHTADSAAGDVTKAYFAGAKTAIDAMDTVCANMEMYLPTKISPTFAQGSYGTYESLMAALRRFYGVDEFQETMVDVIRKIVRIVQSDQRMEQKIAEFKELLHRLMIVDKDKWIKPRDFTDDRSAFMEAAENYGPMMNTMFTAMVFAHTIPQSRWNTIQSLFNARTPDTSYKGWHLNRPELYKIIDAEKKSPGTIAGVQDDDDTVGFAGAFKKGQNKNKRTNKNQKKRQSKPTKSNSVSRMCRHCTQKANKPIYHDAPYGGGANCKVTKPKKSKSTRRVNQVGEDGAGSASDPNDTDGRSSSGDEPDDDEVDALFESYYPSFGGGIGSNI